MRIRPVGEDVKPQTGAHIGPHEIKIFPRRAECKMFDAERREKSAELQCVKPGLCCSFQIVRMNQVRPAEGWKVNEDQGVLVVERNGSVPPESLPILRGRPFDLVLFGPTVTDISILRNLKSLTSLNLSSTKVADVTALKEITLRT
jgi:hypothetical protein